MCAPGKGSFYALRSVHHHLHNVCSAQFVFGGLECEERDEREYLEMQSNTCR